MKFSQKVVIASSALLLIIVTLLSLQQLSTARSGVESLISSSLKEMVAGVRNTISSEMASKKGLVQSTTEVLQLEPRNRDFAKQVMESQQIKSSFLSVGLGYESDGSIIENDDKWEPSSDFDPRIRPWYQSAKQSGKLSITTPYVDASTKKTIITISTPLFDAQGQFVASTLFDMQLNKLADLVNSVDLFGAGYLFIVTEDGLTIAHPNAKLNGEKLKSYLPQVKLEEGTQRFDIDGKTYRVNLTPVPNEKWYIAAIIDESIAYASLTSLRNSSVIYTMVGVLFSLLGLTFLIKILMRPLNTLNEAIQDVASGHGDLTKRLSTDTDLEFAKLAQGFNAFTQSLQQQIQQSKSISSEILRSSEYTVEGSKQAAVAVHRQLHELEQLATAMNEMATTAADVASNAQSAAAAAREADMSTQDGSSVVSRTTASINALATRIDQAVEEVHGLESATANIETILKVINDIADQTNLLALNAAIEAARAGESGRGFAVVADEVRTLARRTQESTTEIRSMIEQLQNGASAVSSVMQESKHTAVEAVERSQEANGALQRIGDAIKRINDMNIQIASAAEEQSLVAEEINSNTLKIKDLSTQVSQAAEEASGAMEEQIANVRQQDGLLNKFIV